jgi:predicted Ser/Thr protein kinase
MFHGLRRASCPAEDDVLAFAQGRLGPEAAARIEAHLDTCEECVHAVAEAAAYVSQDGPSTSTLPAWASIAWSRPPQRIGRFVVESVLGAGGAAVVYAARDPQLERRVAVKVLRGRVSPATDGTSSERLLREAKAMAQLSHPNVVTVFEAGAFGDAGEVFVAMELVQGQTLAAWLRESTPSWSSVLDRFLAAGRGLAAAHDVGIVHRDFKPSNVLVGNDGRVRVGDFGLARAAESASIESSGARPDAGEGASATAVSTESTASWLSLTQTGTLLGTPSFMSPEQFEGEPASAKSDQFSFCVALYRALFHQPPFAGDTMRELAREVSLGRVRRPRRGDVPAAVAAAVLRGLRADPEERHPSMHALLDELARGQRRRSRIGWIAALGAALAIAGAVGVAIVWRGPGEASPRAAAALEAPASPAPGPPSDVAPIAETSAEDEVAEARDTAQPVAANGRATKRRVRRTNDPAETRSRREVPPRNSELREPAFLRDTSR